MVQIVDLFCGVGGLTRGLLDSGLNVVAGFDNDTTCKFTYETNNKVKFNHRNIREVKADEINNCYSENAFKILVGCAPCQPFSQMRFKMGKADRDLSESIYQMLLYNGILKQDIIFTNSLDEEARIPEGISVFDYLREFFVESMNYEFHFYRLKISLFVGRRVA